MSFSETFGKYFLKKATSSLIRNSSTSAKFCLSALSFSNLKLFVSHKFFFYSIIKDHSIPHFTW